MRWHGRNRHGAGPAAAAGIQRLFHSVATGPRQQRRRWTPVGMIVFGASLALVVFGGLMTDRFLPVPALPGDAPWTAAGLALLLAGGLLCGWCTRLFLKARGTPVPLNPPDELIQAGPYAWVRNPMLDGVFLALLGVGLLLRSPSIVFLWTPGYALVHALELKLVEEPELDRRFGVAFRAYRDGVPMFVPRPWRRG